MSDTNIIYLIEALFLFGIFGFFYLYRLRSNIKKEKFDWKKRINRAATIQDKETETSLSLLKVSAVPDTFFNTKLPKIEGLTEWIQHAGLNISPPLFIGTSVVLGIIIGLIFFIILHTKILFSCLIGILSSFVVPWCIISFLTHRLKNKFLEEFPIALGIIHRALRAGHSADRALDMVAEQASGPVGEAFRTITDKMRLGGSPEVVLAEMSNRLGIDDFRMLAIVMVLQRETGGSLAEATENFSKIIRARENLRKKVKALTAEVRVTAIILSLIPFFILGAVYISRPHYLDPLFYTENGHKLLIVGTIMLTLGVGSIIRMAYKEIY